MTDAFKKGEVHFLPVLPLKNVVALPKSVIPVVVGRDVSIKAVEAALRGNREVFVVAQKSSDIELPTKDDIYHFGTRAIILQVGRMQNSTLRILIEGVSRSEVVGFVDTEEYMCVNAQDLLPKPLRNKLEEKAMGRSLLQFFKEYTQLNEKASSEVLTALAGMEDDIDYLIDSITVQMTSLLVKDRQKILETVPLKKRALKLSSLLQDEVEILKAERNIRQRVQDQVEKHQKDYYLNEQIRAIQRELGRDDQQQEINKIREQAKKAKMPAEAAEKVETECRRLEQMQPMSPEASVSRNYVEWLVSLPWKSKSKDMVTLEQARHLLDESHARMLKVKERIIEFLAAKKFAKDKLTKSPIICLAGPPGVGKTSLAAAIAKALGRIMIRISLGGMRDEAEIRGHRRTYIGALPGKIIQAMRKAKVTNPVIVLDEIDKMSMDFRGDPSSALLEVLDPEQNKAFVDHFLEIDYDLSDVMFITTANVVDAIPYPLLDRMEVIQLSGYTLPEKLGIARDFLLPKLLKEHALTGDQVVISDEILSALIEGYTREAGVRQLDRVLAKVLRKSIQEILSAKKVTEVTITSELVELWFGPAKHRVELKKLEDSVGLATGLAWTEVGGDVLDIEITVLKGKGGLTLTGQLGEVMQESAQAAMSYVRSRAKELKIAARTFAENDVHIHFPEGAIPKDGPSAGIVIATALASAFTGRPVKAGVAMTGEVTLRGRVLAVGGLREKILAAIRIGMHTIIVPKENELDIKEFLGEIDNVPQLIYVKTMDEVLEHALQKASVEATTPKKPAVARKKKKNVAKPEKKSPSKKKSAK
ncbi:MAG: ATP-dependent Lon protease [Candidatus Dependentiae bacterium]|nr:ATP-dependent Lon protease [Candidatus Dependentiae bacterium]